MKSFTGTSRRSGTRGGLCQRLATSPETLQDASGTHRNHLDRVVARFDTVERFYGRFDHLCIRCAHSVQQCARVNCDTLAELEKVLFSDANDARAVEILAEACDYTPASTRLMRSWAVEEGAA